MSAPPYKQLVYISSAIRPFSHDELVGLLRVSRRNNEAAGVTGALLYCDGNFMQALEGPAEAVDAAFYRICRDSRHHRTLIMLDAVVMERAFPDWSMGFLNPKDLPEDLRESARSLYALTEPSPGVARRLFSTFRQMLPGERPAYIR